MAPVATALMSSRPCPRFKAQPERDLGGLHRVSNHHHKIVAQSVQIRFVAYLSREGFEGLSRIVLPTVEAPIYERLDTVSQRGE